uniref:Uncharacterized protein n=1 Tax=Anguilla anguilla TaxID=7936 RepID=A0A0E9PSX7_ANGAN
MLDVAVISLRVAVFAGGDVGVLVQVDEVEDDS